VPVYCKHSFAESGTDREQALDDAIRDNLHKVPTTQEIDDSIVWYIKHRQRWWAQRGHFGERLIDNKRFKKYDWSQEGVLSDANAAIAEVIGVSPDRVAKVRRRAEAAGNLDAADVFIGKITILRYAREQVGRQLGTSPSDNKGDVALFTFTLPDGNTLTATSQQDLDEKGAWLVHGLFQMQTVYRSSSSRYQTAVCSRPPRRMT